MIVYRAAWVCPIDQPPIAQGWVATDHGRILAVGGPADLLPDTGDRPLQKTGGDRLLQETGRNRAQPLVRRDLGHVALMPGLVNAHTHLELSWLRDRVPPSASFVGWITQLFALRQKAGGSRRSRGAVGRAPSGARGARLRNRGRRRHQQFARVGCADGGGRTPGSDLSRAARLLRARRKLDRCVRRACGNRPLLEAPVSPSPLTLPTRPRRSSSERFGRP